MHDPEFSSTLLRWLRPPTSQRSGKHEDYFELFYGRLSLVEGESVKKAMETFIPLIPKADPESLPVEALKKPSYQLTIELKKELSDAWKTPFGELNP